MNTFHILSRRDFLKATAATAFLAHLPSSLHAGGSDAVTISILHTTDLHGHILPTQTYEGVQDVGGIARCMSQIRQWKKENPNNILIDVGDIYQGTDVSFRNRGKLMLDLLNMTGYEAWVVGNHEFDWGLEPFQNAVAQSTMPVLASNMFIEGQKPGSVADSANPFAKVRPYVIKEVAGIKIAIVGVTNPGMEYWLHPDFIHGLSFVDPVDTARAAILQAKAEGASAIILAGHMGVKERGDDFANRVFTLASQLPDIDVFIAGHTHQDRPKELAASVLYTQANYYGINCGKVDLTFDRASKKLIAKDVGTLLMDHNIALDGAIISRSQPELDASLETMKTPVGTLADRLEVKIAPTEPSDVEKLIGASIFSAFRERGTNVDAVFHGLFQGGEAVQPGDKTIADIWKIIPYENYLLTGEVTRDDLLAVMNETEATHSPRSLLGFQARGEKKGSGFVFTDILDRNGQPLPAGKRFTVAMNSFDAQSGGQRMMTLRRIMRSAEAKEKMTPVQTREALITYFQHQKTVRLADLNQELA